jgi:hypothetical protein
MNVIEAGELLGVCAAFDNRTTGAANVVAWAEQLGDLDYTDCEQAVIAHYRDTDEWIKPVHIRRRALAMRRDRIERAGLLIGPPDELADDPQSWLKAYRRQRRAVADGQLRPAVTSAGRRVLAAQAEQLAIEGVAVSGGHQDAS